MRVRILVLIFLLLAATAATFLPSLDNGFTNWDDDRYVADNMHIRSLSFGNTAKIFSRFYVANYQPLTMLTYALDHYFSGLNPSAFHRTNLLIHLANVLLLFWLIFLLSQNLVVSFLTGLLFGIHPLHVESVAWIAARKDLLSCFFFLVALISYLYFLKKNERRYYLMTFLFFILSLLSKAVTMVFPFVLLLCDDYLNKKIDRKAVRDKLPFFLTAFIFGILAFFAQHVSGAIGYKYLWSFLRSAGTASYALMFYLVKTLFPAGLSCFYPYPRTMPVPGFIALFAAVLFLGAVSVYSRRTSKKLFFGVTLFFITILPVLQFVPIGQAAVADRYTYIPLIGIFYIAAEACNGLYRKSKLSLVVLLIAMAAGLSFLSNRRCRVWQDSVSLWEDALRKHPGEALALNNRGQAYYAKGEFNKALSDFNDVIRMNPFLAKAYYNRANLYRAKGDFDKALADYDRALSLEPQNFEHYNERGIAYQLKGDLKSALADYNQVLRRNPFYSNAYNNRAILYRSLGLYDQAFSDYSEAIRFNPDSGSTYANRAVAYHHNHQDRKAWEDVQKALALGFAVDAQFLETVRKEIEPPKE